MEPLRKLPYVPQIKASEIIEDPSHRFVTDEEKAQWNLGGSGGYDGNPETIVQTANYRFVSDVEKTTWNSKIASNDARLSDARTPLAHTHPAAEVTESTTRRFITDTERTTWNAKVSTDDARLSDARTPTAHTHVATEITEDSTHRFVTDAEKTSWNSKAAALGADDNYVTDAEKVKLANLSGVNTGDNAVNTLYSGLAASKQDALVSGTNIKTVNGTSLLGSGNVVVSGSTPELIVTRLTPTASQTITSGYGAVIPGDYKIADTLFTKIENGAQLKII